jgi:hypothetical protein
LPGAESRQTFHWIAAEGRALRFTSILDWSGAVQATEVAGDTIRMVAPAGSVAVQLTPTDARVEAGGKRVTLAGRRPPARPIESLFASQGRYRNRGEAYWVSVRPALDGTTDGFEHGEPLRLEDEGQYFRSEEPYTGPGDFSARALVNWNEDGLFLAVSVTKPELMFRAPDAPPLRLDNEADDIHSDGIQVYYALGDGADVGFLIRPAPDGALLWRPLTSGAAGLSVSGAYHLTQRGYRITAALPCEGLRAPDHPRHLSFDLCINEMREGRVRRAGQLIWSGGPGWVYLRGDRHDRERFGRLDLIG